MTSTSFVGIVPNSNKGWSYINAVRQHLRGSNIRLKAFGRNKNRKQYANNPSMVRQYRCNLPLKYATHYGLYLYAKDNNVFNTQADIENTKKFMNSMVKIFNQIPNY